MPHEPVVTEFYAKVSKSFLDTQIHQIQKGAEKYPEPFNPHSWTTDELLEHGMQEAVDLMTYLVGMSEKVRLLEAENKRLQENVRILSDMKPNHSERILLNEFFRKPAYADLDD